MKKRYWIAIAVLGLMALGFAMLYTPSIPHDELAGRYATPPSAFIDLPGGGRAHYRDQGPRNAIPIVLIHGSNASLFTWEPWVARLREDHRVITVDMPGHGLTGPVPGNDYWVAGMTGFIDQFATALGLDQFVIGGNSMGGGMSAAYTLAHPDRVMALILVDAAGMPADRFEEIESPLGFRIAHTPGLRWLATKITPRSIVAEGVYNVMENDSIVTEAMIDRYWHLLRHPGNRAATVARFKAAVDQPMDLAFENIDVPTLIIWGEQDRLIPLANGRSMHRRIPNARLLALDGVGHIPMEEAPDRTAQAVADFLDAALPAEKK